MLSCQRRLRWPTFGCRAMAALIVVMLTGDTPSCNLVPTTATTCGVRASKLRADRLAVQVQHEQSSLHRSSSLHSQAQSRETASAALRQHGTLKKRRAVRTRETRLRCRRTEKPQRWGEHLQVLLRPSIGIARTATHPPTHTHTPRDNEPSK